MALVFCLAFAIVILIIVYFVFASHRPRPSCVPFDAIKDKMRTGDLLLFNYDKFSLHRALLNLRFNHCGMIVKDPADGKLYIAEKNGPRQLYYLHIGTSGSHFIPLDKRLNGYPGYFTWVPLGGPPLPDRVLRDIVTFARTRREPFTWSDHCVCYVHKLLSALGLLADGTSCTLSEILFAWNLVRRPIKLKAPYAYESSVDFVLT